MTCTCFHRWKRRRRLKRIRRALKLRRLGVAYSECWSEEVAAGFILRLIFAAIIAMVLLLIWLLKGL